MIIILLPKMQGWLLKGITSVEQALNWLLTVYLAAYHTVGLLIWVPFFLVLLFWSVRYAHWSLKLILPLAFLIIILGYVVPVSDLASDEHLDRRDLSVDYDVRCFQPGVPKSADFHEFCTLQHKRLARDVLRHANKIVVDRWAGLFQRLGESTVNMALLALVLSLGMLFGVIACCLYCQRNLYAQARRAATMPRTTAAPPVIHEKTYHVD